MKQRLADRFIRDTSLACTYVSESDAGCLSLVKL